MPTAGCGLGPATSTRGFGSAYRRGPRRAECHSLVLVRLAVIALNSGQDTRANSGVISAIPGVNSEHNVSANSSVMSVLGAWPVLWVQYRGLHLPRTKL